MCDSVYPLATVTAAQIAAAPTTPSDKEIQGKTLYLKFPSIDHPAVRHMKLVFNMFPGTTQVKMVMADTRKVFATQVLLHKALVDEAKETLGEENVVVK
jgi:DNA polymerase-3 subunit alpha